MGPERAAAPGSTPGTTAKTTASPLTSSSDRNDRTDVERTPRRCTPTRETERLSTGRVIPEAECTWSTSIFDVLESEAPTFTDPEEVGRWVGCFYGYRSTTPTHAWGDWDGVGWWVLDALAMIHTGWPVSYFDLVPGLDFMSSGWHARAVLAAFEAAGLVLAPIERVAVA
jgi:hypothetical protein